MFVRNNNRLKRMTSLAILLALVVPALVTATVVISDVYPISGSAQSPSIYLAEGPNYGVASNLGLISATAQAIGSNYYIPAGTITINSVTGSSNVYLLNVLEIYNSSGWDSGKYAVNLWINGSLPTGVSMYVSTSPVSLSGLSSLTPYSSPDGPIPISTTGNVLYFSFVSENAAAGSGQLTFQFTVD